MDGILTSISTLDQSEHGSYGNKEVLNTPEGSRTRTSRSDVDKRYTLDTTFVERGLTLWQGML